MKKILLVLFVLVFVIKFSFSQNRVVFGGAEPGELYLATYWYGIYAGPYYSDLRTAVYRITENGKKLSIQYNVDYFVNNYTVPGSVMQPGFILTDATPGVIYTKRNYSKNSNPHTQLWVSFDFGKSWIFQEDKMGRIGYFSAGLNNGVIHKGGENRTVLESENYGVTYDYYLFSVPIPYSTREIAYQGCEFFGFGTSPSYQLQYTNDCANSFTIIPIDEQYVFGWQYGVFPDVFRGGFAGGGVCRFVVSGVCV